MEEIIWLKDNLDLILNSAGFLAPILASLLILLESFLPILPVFLFISINILVLGNFFGFLLSYICSVIASYLAFILVRRKFSNYFSNKLKRTHKYVNKLNFISLTVLLSLPYVPSSVINFIVGIGKLNEKKYLCSLLISKFFVVLFWGYIGTSFYDSVRDKRILLTLIVMLIVVYLISKLVEKIIERRINT